MFLVSQVGNGQLDDATLEVSKGEDVFWVRKKMSPVGLKHGCFFCIYTSVDKGKQHILCELMSSSL